MPALLITGRPGCGKTTLVRRVLHALGVPADGFYTRETRGPDGRRTGFELVTLDGRVATLAHVALQSQQRVGRYGVDVAELERVGVAAIVGAHGRAPLLVIDEIGKMELLSMAFRRAVREALERGRAVFGTIMQAPHPFADELKARPDVVVLTLTEVSRERLRAQAEAQLRALLGRMAV